MGLQNIIVNADDFGKNESVNRAIVYLFKEGTLHSTSLMANMPGFEHAVRLSHRYGIVNNIGVHLVLTSGDPLTEEIKNIPYLFNNGIDLHNLRIRKLNFLSRKHKQYIYNEFAAQIEKIRSEKIPINHIDTHHQIHDSFPILFIIFKLLKNYDIPFVRILNNLEKVSVLKNTYRHFMNSFIKFRKLNYSDYFGDQIAFLNFMKNNKNFSENRVVEIMVHPDYNYQGEIIDHVGGKELDFNVLSQLFKNN